MSGKIVRINRKNVTITGQGAPGNLYNTDFILTFYDANENFILTTPSFPRSSSTFIYTLSDDQYNAIMNAPGNTFSARLTSTANHYDSEAPEGEENVTAGPYYSPLYTYSK